MSKENHDWRPGEPAPFIRAHSQVKHRILDEYLQRYVATLTANPRRPQLRLTVVDGFAGGGCYRDEITHEFRPGSPLITLAAMKSASIAAQNSRTNGFNLDVEYFFVEKKRAAFEYLTSTLRDSEFRDCVGGRVHLLRGKVESSIDRIIARVKQRGGGERAIFIFDQFGYVDAPFPMIRKVLTQLSNAEVILTFATDFLIDYLSTRPESQKSLGKTGIELSAETIEAHKQQSHWRWLIQRDLHHEIQRNSGAEHYTPFFIRSKDAHRDFWLIHLSGHARARDVMVGLHWKENNSFAHYGRPGLNMLGYDQDRDSKLTGISQLPIFRFDGGAREECKSALVDELPKRIADNYQGGLLFNDFFAAITNETPATSEIMKDALRQLAKEGIVEILDKGGKKKRRITSGSDTLRYSRQKRLFLP